MKIFYFFILIAGSLSICFSQLRTNDTLAVYPFPEVIVTATRSAIPIRDVPVNIEVFGLNDIKAANGSSVVDLLKNSTGIFISDFGGGASLKTGSLRGTSSQNLLILVDGIRQNNMQNGLGYLNQELLSDIDAVEIVHGGNSALYGSDAVGGVVNIITKKPRLHTGAEMITSVGSYGLFSYLLGFDGNFGNIGLHTDITLERSKDNYSYVNKETGITELRSERINADYIKRKFTVSITAVPHQKATLNIQTRLYKTEFGVPGSMSFPSPLARQSDEDAGISANYESNILNNMLLTVTAAYRYTLENYKDPQAYFPVDSYYKYLQMILNPQITSKMTDNFRTIIGGEFSEGVLFSNDFDSRILRSQKAFYFSGETELSYNRDYLDRFLLFQTVRYDNSSDVAYAITPKIGLNTRLMKKGDLRFRASAGQNFRVPTLNDLYFRNFSNPNLKSERSSCLDAGLSAVVKLGGEHRASLTYFYQDITDRIIFDLVTFSPQNLGKVVSNGLEARYECNLFDRLINIDVNYTFTDAKKMNRETNIDSSYRKQLTYVPKNLFNVRLSIQISPVILTIFHNYVGRRYTTADNSLSVPSYGVVSANIRTELKIMGMILMLKGEISNIFDKSYELFDRYPMTGRIYRGTIGLSY